MSRKFNSVILISLSNLFFPIIGLFINIIYYFTNNLSSQQKKIIYFNMAFSFAFIGFLYIRVNESGDLYKYSLSLYYYSKSLLNGRVHIINSLYESFYPVWYFVIYITSKLNLSIQFINFLAGFTIYSSLLFVIYKLDYKYSIINNDKNIILKVFLMISFVGLFSSYKTLWAFSLINIGLYFLMIEKKRAYIFILLGAGIHPISYIPVLIYFISRIFKFKIIYLYLSLFFGLIFKQFITLFSSLLIIPFIGSKINTYIYGKWSLYRFQDNSEYVKFILLVIFIVFVFTIIVFKFIDFENIKDRYFQHYNNFILWYFSITLWFITFRTIELRLMIDGFIFFIPLFYQIFMYRRIYKKRLLSVFLLLLWLLLIDIRTFNIFNNAYQVGSGLPFNIFSSPLSYILEGVI